MTQPTLHKPGRLLALIGMLYTTRDLADTSTDAPDPLTRTCLQATVDAVDELHSTFGIFDSLGAYCLRQKLKDENLWMMDCRELMNVIVSDYGLYVIKYIVEDLPESGVFTWTDVEQAIDRIIADSNKSVEHQRQNPGYYDVQFTYPPQGNTELARVSLARKLPTLQKGTPGRTAMLELIMGYSKELRHCLVIQAAERQKKLTEEANALLGHYARIDQDPSANPIGLGGS